MSAMRLSLWTGLLATVVYNQNRQQNRVRIFEAVCVSYQILQAPLGIRQDLMLAGVICGNRYEEHWNLAKETVDFYDLKGDLESVLDLTGKLNEVEFRAEANPALHPGGGAIYLKGERIGFVGLFILNWNVNWILTVALWCSNWSGTSSQTAWCLRRARFLAFRRTVVTSRWWSQKTFRSGYFIRM
ncbi:hypothetical protein ACLB1Q_03745 [Escherichia coli]